MSKEELKELADMDIYESGSRGSFGNNFKLTAIIRGAVKNYADPSEIMISRSNLEDGTDPNELHMYGDIMTAGSAGRALGTREGGYEAKKLMASYQTVVLGKPGSDCGTNRYLDVVLDNDNRKLLMYRYFILNGKEYYLTPDNYKEYLNKALKFRSPMYCTDDKICNKCSGELPYSMGIENYGLLVNQVAQAIVTSSMKSFHDMTIKLNEVNIQDYIDSE